MKRTLPELRVEIDKTDHEIQALLNKRAALSEEVGKIKQQESNPVFHRPEREAEILRTVAQRNSGPLRDDGLTSIFQSILTSSCNLQIKQYAQSQASRNINRLIIVGLGLMGSSIAKCLKEQGDCHIIGMDSNKEHLEHALSTGLIDSAQEEFKQTESIDLIILCTPANTIATLLKALAPHLADATTITDVASTKQEIAKQAQEILGDKVQQYIPSHPLTGKETSGPLAADSNLFSNKKVLITPFETHNTASLEMAKSLWQHCGAHTQMVSAEKHDRALALTSHLPQMLSFAYMTCFENCIDNKKYGAGSFADFTRIAASNPIMWQAICSSNKENIVAALNSLKEKLNTLEKHISNENTQDLIIFFELANVIKKENT
jgi:chorismate mutase-like protein